MKYTFVIRHNPTGEVRHYADPFDWDDEEVMEFAYTDGNYGCDCNRSLFFADANGEERSHGNVECGGDVYSIPYATREDGVRIWLDDEPNNETMEVTHD